MGSSSCCRGRGGRAARRGSSQTAELFTPHHSSQAHDEPLEKGLVKGVGFGNCCPDWMRSLEQRSTRTTTNVYLLSIMQTSPMEPPRHELLGNLLSGAALPVAHFARQDGASSAPTTPAHEGISIHAGRSGAAHAIG